MTNLFLNWTALDYALAAVMFFSVILSFFRGFIREAISLVTWFLAFYFALQFAPTLSGALHFISNPKISYAISAILIFLIVLLLGKIVGKLAHEVMKISLLGFFDKILGFIFGVVRGALFITIILFVIELTSWHTAAWYQHSQLAPHFQKCVDYCRTLLPKELLPKSGFIDQMKAITNSLISAVKK